MKLRDIFLLPREFYHGLTDNRFTLYLGILLVGMRDTGFYLWGSSDVFSPARVQDVLLRNLPIILGFVVLIGLLDVIFFSFPVYDILKLMKRREEDSAAVKGSVIRLMKVYILANLFVTPIEIILTVIGIKFDLATFNVFLLALISMVFYANMLWYFAVIARGAAAIFNFKGVHIAFVFIIVLLYSELLGYAYKFIYEKGLLVLLK